MSQINIRFLIPVNRPNVSPLIQSTQSHYFQYILDKHLVLNIYRSTFNCDNTLFPYNDPHIEPMFVDFNSSQGITKSSAIEVLDNNNTSIFTNSRYTILRNDNSTRDLPI